MFRKFLKGLFTLIGVGFVVLLFHAMGSDNQRATELRQCR